MVQTYRPIPVPSDSILTDLAQTYHLFLEAYKRKSPIHIAISIFAELVFGLERWQIELSRTARHSTVIQSLNSGFADKFPSFSGSRRCGIYVRSKRAWRK